MVMLKRLERKLAEVQRWVDSVAALSDVPSAMALAFFRSRPAEGRGLLARLSRTIAPVVWVRPAALRGWSIRIEPEDLSQFVIYEEVFIEKVYDLERVTFAPDCIIDCGAFQGYFSLLAASKFHTPVLAFEPNARNYDGLLANIAANAAPIEARPHAVAANDGVASFSGGGCGGRLGDGADSVQVIVDNLCRIIHELAPQRLLLKLDIEGEESHLLPALLPVLPSQTAIFFEWHHGRTSFVAVADELTRHGFSVTQTRANHADAELYIDAFAQR